MKASRVFKFESSCTPMYLTSSCDGSVVTSRYPEHRVSYVVVSLLLITLLDLLPLSYRRTAPLVPRVPRAASPIDSIGCLLLPLVSRLGFAQASPLLDVTGLQAVLAPAHALVRRF
jgi:hypothetical protein